VLLTMASASDVRHNEEIRSDIRDPHFHNWLSVAVALKAFSKSVDRCVRDVFTTWYQTVQGKHAALPPCVETEGCSRKPGGHKWCQTCLAWKHDILPVYTDGTTSRGSKIKWRDFNSAKWPTDIDEVVAVYLKDRSGTFSIKTSTSKANDLP
jgi:hypothetical protein